TNLVNNAVKFTERGQITIAIGKVADEKDGIRLRFSITDTGIGLTPEQMGKLFNAFSQADSSTSRKYGGTGLGLSISKRLVELMQGEIGVESQAGVGSIFHFTACFGVRPAGSHEPEEDPARHPLSAESARILHGARLLLVEDHPVNRELAMEILHGAGIRVEIAVNGEEALFKLKEKRYDGVLMDCQMPVMDGYEATRRIRENPALESLPILAMTANALGEEREKCLECGMNDHIAKPLDVAGLFVTLARWIKQARQTDGADAQDETMEEVTDPGRARLPRIPELEMDQALRRMGGSTTLLKRMLTRFHETQKSFPERLITLQTAGNQETAIRETHTFRGLAANVGALDLVKKARDVEEILKCDLRSPAFPAAMAALTQEHRRLFARLDQTFSDMNASDARKPQGSVNVDPEALSLEMREMAHLLGEYDSTAGNKVHAMVKKLQILGLATLAEDLRKSIEQYEFEESLDILTKIAQTCAIRL
ncbi:MAG: response regulator, partial [Magnetococcales bacterium]|nr:response regulator [Magnetococcales bacterium]